LKKLFTILILILILELPLFSGDHALGGKSWKIGGSIFFASQTMEETKTQIIGFDLDLNYFLTKQFAAGFNLGLIKYSRNSFNSDYEMYGVYLSLSYYFKNPLNNTIIPYFKFSSGPFWRNDNLTLLFFLIRAFL